MAYIESTKSKALVLGTVIAVLTFIVVGGSFAVNKINSSKGKVPEVAVINTEKVTNAVLGEQTLTKSLVYSVSAKERVNADNIEYVVTVKNNSKKRVEYSPGLQFKLVDTKDLSFETVTQPKGTILMSGGPIEPGQEATGSLFFKLPKNSNSELRFYPDVESTDYTTVQTK